MTVIELINLLKAAALENPLIKTVVGNVDRMSSYTDLKYGVYTWEIGTVEIDKGYLTLNASLYYISRINAKKQSSDDERVEDNALEVQSLGIDVLQNIIKTIEPIGIVNVVYDVFTHQFLDMCAGARANVSIRVPYTYCYD